MPRLEIGGAPAIWVERGIWGAAALLLAVAAVVSLPWRITVDAPLLAYAALAIDKWGLTPYRDIFDFNTPGAYATNMLIGRVFGYDEAGFRFGDLFALLILLALTASALRSFGWRSALASVLVFGGVYLGYGPAMSLQREFLLLLPVAASLSAAFATNIKEIWRIAIVGACIGVAATIKPQASPLLAVFLMWWAWSAPASFAGNVRRIACSVVAFAIPVASAMLWVWSAGGLPAFIDIAAQYWPLYNELTGARPHHIVQGGELWSYRLHRFVFARDLRHSLWLPAIAGVAIAIRHASPRSTQQSRLALLVAVALVLAVYPLAAGKFWAYHWLPSLYGASILASLCFVERVPSTSRVHAALPAIAVLILAAQVPGLQNLVRQWRMDGLTTQSRVAHAIADVLKPRLREGDTVQPLDWTGGAAHAMFLTEARIATPFLYDFYFYHHVSSPYVQALRRRFTLALDTAKPAFIVAADQERRFEGPDTTYQFNELSEILRRDYHAIAASDRFQIYERNDRASR